MSLSLEVNVYGGTPIEIAAHDACELARELKITITFDFNGVHCMALPGGDSKTLVHNWNIARDRGGQYPIASTNVR